MSEQEFLTRFYWCVGILSILLSVAIIGLIIGIIEEEKQHSQSMKKNSEAYFNGPVWTYWPSLRLKKKK